MTVNKIVEELRRRRLALDEAIAALEAMRAAGRPGPRRRGGRGRTTGGAGKQPKRVLSNAARRRMAEAQRKRWAAWRAARNAA